MPQDFEYFEDKKSDERLGAYIVRAREARGFSLDDLSTETKIGVNYLQWIEESAWEHFPVQAYLRSYLNSVSDKLLLDRKKVLNWFAEENGSKYSATIEEVFSSDYAEERKKSHLLPVVVVLVLLVALGAVIYVMNLADSGDKEVFTDASNTAEPFVAESFQMPEGAEVIPPDSVVSDSQYIADSLEADSIRRVVDSLAKSKDLPASATLFISSGSTAPETKPEAEAAPKNYKGSNLKFVASGNGTSWIGVKKSADGEVYAKQANLTEAEQVFTYAGSDTLYVIIGNLAAVKSVTLNGSEVSLPGHSEGRSQRFRFIGSKVLRGF